MSLSTVNGIGGIGGLRDTPTLPGVGGAIGSNTPDTTPEVPSNIPNTTAQNGGYDALYEQLQGGLIDPKGFFELYNEQAEKATEQQRVWSAQQAQKQMDFQERMANSQYQRAAEDMKKAGLNPYLLMAGASANSAPNGAMATSNTADVYKTNDTLQRDTVILDFMYKMYNTAVSAIADIIPG